MTGPNAAPSQRSAVNDAQYLADEDGDDVFSNIDASELESRSDATGATSPTPNSPGGPGSPSNRLSSHVAIVSGSGYGGVLGSSGNTSSHHHSTISDPFGSFHHGDTSHKPLILSQLPPPPSAADFDRHILGHDETPRPSPAQLRASTPRGATKDDEVVGTMKRSQLSRPSFLRTKSASGAGVASLGSPSSSSNPSALAQAYTPGVNRLGGHAASLSASHASMNAKQLPSAHGLPSDPREAMSLSTLFAHAPMQSPGEEQPAFFLTPAHTSNATTTKSPDASRDLALSAHAGSSLGPTSPERLMTKHQVGVSSVKHSPRLSVSQGGEDFGSGASSIFERDIEHRNTSHVLSKAEAIDVAIPSVLDDAIEAIAAEDADIEIVAPHTAVPPLALSAQALTIHSQSHSAKVSTTAAAATSPTLSESPPMSIAGGVTTSNEPPPGSIAAQLAERFGQQRGSESAIGVSANMSRHRRPISDASISSSSSMRSRSPQAPLASVQNVLAGSASPTAARSASHSPPAPNKLSTSPSIVGDSPSRSRAGRAGVTLQPSNSTLTPTSSKVAGLPTASAIPSLPLPNPFRGASPSASFTPQMGALEAGSFPMQSSVSMDGAIMPSSESATLDASLDGLADAVTSRTPSGLKSLTSSPVTRLRGLALVDDTPGVVETSPYSSRSPARLVAPTAPTSPTSAVASRQRPTSAATGTSHGLEASPSALKLETNPNVSGLGNIAAKKRLSFFSYADILNEAPAEVMRMDEALQQSAHLATRNESSEARPKA